MARPLVSVRDATPDDAPELVTMWTELRELSGRHDRTMPQASGAGVLARLREAQQSPGARIVVACIADEVVGMAVLTRQPFAALLELSAVHVDYLHVRPGHRRRGVGHALVAAATAYAEEVGAEHLLTGVVPQLREAQRFYARLGFSPLAVRRAAPVATVRRKLAGERPAYGPSYGIDGLLARRRSIRTRSIHTRGRTAT